MGKASCAKISFSVVMKNFSCMNDECEHFAEMLWSEDDCTPETCPLLKGKTDE